ncbi:uncharacterized protein L201_001647 [Kwoniella dendrophila CBS 6074]|uniref:UDENN domain-containing protein n=1 Tax=Kwoniella dendrophila CBS 6074 TaxID=1295534 RepID=A0AAX4JPF7_9TREE
MVALGLNSLGRSSGRKFSSEESTSTSLPTVPHKPTHFPQTPYLQSLSSKPTQTPLEDNPSVKIDPFARNDGLQHSSIYNSFTSSNKSPISTSNSPATRYPSEKTKFPSTSSTFQQQKGPIHDNKHRRQDSEFSLDRQVVDIVADYIKPEKDFIDTASNKPNFKSNEPLSSSPLPTIAFGRQDRPVGSRQSSFADQSAPPSPLNTPSILSQESIVTPKLPTKNLPLPSLTNNMPRSNSHTNSAGLGGNIRRGGSRTSDRNTTNNNASPGMLERMEEADELRGLRNDSMPNIYNNQYDKNNFNQSSTSVSSKTKADKMLGIDSRNAKLASLYLVSGLGKSTAQWSFADSDSSRGVQPIEDSLGLFWRPEMLGSSFSGENQESSSSRARKESKSSTLSNGLSKDIRGKYVPDAGPDGPQRLVSKTIKFAHPRGIEVVNSTLSPPTTCHAFTFTIPRHDTLAAIARTRLNSAMSGNPNTYSVLSNVDETGNLDPSLHLQSRSRAGGPNIRNSSSSTSPTELTYYGVTLTVWTHADRERALQLKTIKMRNDRIKLGQGSLNSISPNKKGSSTPSENIGGGKKGTKRGSLHYMISKNQSEGDITASSETETGMSDSDLEGPLGRRGFIGGNKTRLSTVDSVPEDVAAAYDEASDIFWMPYAITMVSRFPIYDLLQDYLRLSWARFSKNAKVHMTQINRILNYNPPRPGESISLPVGEKPEDEVTIEGHMPGGLMDFEKGLMKIDFQLWPLFQAVDIDHILSAAEVALSNSGRIIFCSKHPAMLNVAVSTLKYVVELRGWDGICMPVIHARDATFIIEDPGPYIIGMPTECRYLLAPPPEVVIIDIDTK